MSNVPEDITAESDLTGWGCTHSHDDHGRRLQWEEKQHAFLVDSAFGNLQKWLVSFPKDTALQWIDTLYRSDAFKQAMHRALVEVDSLTTYWGGLTGFRAHFYNPESRQNWLYQTEPTAYTQAMGCAIGATSLGTAPARFGDVGYAMGEAMHYLTDLSQPMHAANFINKPGFDKRHSMFEKYIDAHVTDYAYLADKVTLEIVKKDWPADLGGIINQLATRSLALYRTAPFTTMLKHMQFSGGEPTKDDVNDIAITALTNGHQAAAAFLYRWAQQAMAWTPSEKQSDPYDWPYTPFALAGRHWGVVARQNKAGFAFTDFDGKRTGMFEQFRSDESPAAFSTDKHVFIAWRAYQGRELHFAASTTADIGSFPAWASSLIDNARLEDRTAPAMAAYRMRIALAWSDTGEKLAGGSGVRILELDLDGKAQGAPVMVPNTDTRRSPSLAMVQDRLWLAWIGSGDGNIYLARDNGPGKSGWERMTVPGKWSESAPALCDMGGLPGLFWRGADNIVRMSTFLDGKWTAEQKLPVAGNFPVKSDVHALLVADEIIVSVSADKVTYYTFGRLAPKS